MSIRSNARGLSFEVLSGGQEPSGDLSSGEPAPPLKRKRKPRKKKHKGSVTALETIPNSDDESLLLRAQEIAQIRFKDLESRRSLRGSTTTVVSQVHDSPSVSCVSFVELRQRNVNGGLGDSDALDQVGINREAQEVNVGFKREGQEFNVGFTREGQEFNVGRKGLEKEKSLDWDQVLKENTDLLPGKFSL